MKLTDHLRELAAELEIAKLTAAGVDKIADKLRGLAQRLDGPFFANAGDGTCAGPQCGRPIVWATLAGKPHPCDPAIRAIITEDGRIVRGRESHYATCPNAADFRR